VFEDLKRFISHHLIKSFVWVSFKLAYPAPIGVGVFYGVVGNVGVAAILNRANTQAVVQNYSLK
jgi:hypothetical protein